MSRKVFEYFFDPDDLEPFYSELPASFRESKPRPSHDAPRPAAQVESTPNCDHLDTPGVRIVPTESTNRDASDGEEIEETCQEARSTEVSVESESAPERGASFDEIDASESVAVSAEPNRTRVRRLLSVHALGQYVYCPRAAILSAEEGDRDDVDDELPRCTYLPNFDRERIEEKLSAKMTQLAFFALYGICLIVLMKMGIGEQKRWIFYPSLLAFLGLSYWSFDVSVCIVELAIRRRAAIRAEGREPEPDIAGIERVNWWSMLKAGFEPINHDQPFQHPELSLEGAPWRVLQRDSRRIPVVKSGSRKLGDRKGEMYLKHQVRLAAYAMLLESTAHLEVPYGLAFPVDSPRGLAFPITEEARNRAVRLLHDFEQKLVESQQHNIQPQLPENRNRCTNCGYGKPVPTTAREVKRARKSGQQIVVLQHGSGDLFHCACGDRFGSAPPHGLTVRKKLTAVVS